MEFMDSVVDELRAMADAGIISNRKLAHTVRMVRDNPDMFGDDYGIDGRRDSVMSVEDAADLALSF